MKWIRGGKPLEQAQTKVDPPDDEEYRPYRGYPVTMIVNGKRVTAWVYD